MLLLLSLLLLLLNNEDDDDDDDSVVVPPRTKMAPFCSFVTCDALTVAAAAKATRVTAVGFMVPINFLNCQFLRKPKVVPFRRAATWN